MEERKTEAGAMVIEATIVFPIVFFVILFLIYFGNVFYVRSKVEAATEIMAVKGAAYYTDPMLAQIGESGSAPLRFKEIRPYRYWFKTSSVEQQIRDELNQKLGKVGTGFFSGMSPSVIKVQAAYENHLFYDTFVVEVAYQIRFPIRFIWSEDSLSLKMSAKSVASATDTDEFIRNTDMILDYYDSSGLAAKVKEVVDKAKAFITGNGRMKN